jgi:glucose-1-phosphatase
MDVDVVFFDLGDVVCQFQPDVRLVALAEPCHVEPDVVHRALFASGFDDECEIGQHDEAEVLRRVRALGFGGTVRELRRLWSLAFAPDDSVLALVGRVRAARRVAMLTNNGPVLREALPAELSHVAAAFDHVFFSCDFGIRKPDPALFAATLKKVGTPPHRALLIDDAGRNVESARTVGMHAYQFTDAPALEQELERAGLLTT